MRSNYKKDDACLFYGSKAANFYEAMERVCIGQLYQVFLFLERSYVTSYCHNNPKRNQTFIFIEHHNVHFHFNISVKWYHCGMDLAA